MGFSEEQNEILCILENLKSKSGRKWYKYKGDVANRIILRFLQRHITDYKVVGPSVFIEDNPTEFDILVVDQDASPSEYTNAFNRDSVKLVIEVKKHGFYFKKVDAEARIKECVEPFESTGIPYLYVSIQESERFIEATRNVLRDRAHFLKVSFSGELVKDGWQNFVNKVIEVLKHSSIK